MLANERFLWQQLMSRRRRSTETLYAVVVRQLGQCAIQAEDVSDSSDRGYDRVGDAQSFGTGIAFGLRWGGIGSSNKDREGGWAGGGFPLFFSAAPAALVGVVESGRLRRDGLGGTA